MFDYIRYIQGRDSAKPTFLEVFLGYNGFHAIIWHRLNHALWSVGLRALARFLANLSRILTGIEIHPEAQIGKKVFIDHGTGLVVGQTAIIGNEVTIYHDVTLGGISTTGDVKGKRHPTIEDGAVIGAGAQVLGNITIGEKARVGANSVVLRDVPEGCTVVGNPARLVRCKKADGVRKAYGFPEHTVDPIAEAIDGLMRDVQNLKVQAGIFEPGEDENEENYAEKWLGGGI